MIKTMGKKIINAVPVLLLILALLLLIIEFTRSQPPRRVYEERKEVVLTDTTNTYPEPDSLVHLDGNVTHNTYRKKTLELISNRFNFDK